MKKLFNRTKRPEQEWEGYDESEYDWDSANEPDEDIVYSDGADEGYYYRDDESEEDGDVGYAVGEELEDVEYYTGEEEPEEAEYYASEKGIEEAEYFAGEEGLEEVGYFAVEERLEDAEYYAGEEDGGAYHELDADGETDFLEAGYGDGGTDGYYAEGYDAETDSYDDPEDEIYDAYDPEDEDPVVIPVRNGGGGNAGFLAKLFKGLTSMGAMDRIILATGVGVLILALVTGSVYVSSRNTDRQVSSFVSVGTQLDNIDTIGGAGILAVADARQAKLAAADILLGLEDEDENKSYDEEEYAREITVALDMVSIQRDLKVKFINRKTNKLIANVPFAVTVTDPDGKTAIWSDDDMDGIIYKKDITPGSYQVVMSPLTDTRYADYSISTATERVEVKKDIDYKKVDVANEVKSESEVNVQKEDTKVNETKVESVLQDTVAWVESRVLSASYNEVAKSSIPDPLTLLALNKTFLRAAAIIDGEDLPSQEAADGSGTSEPEETSGIDLQTETPTSEPETPVPTQEPDPTPTLTPSPVHEPDPTSMLTPTPTQEPDPTPTLTPTPTQEPDPTLTLTPTPTREPDPTPTLTPTPDATSSPIDVSNMITSLTPPSVSIVAGQTAVSQAAVSGADGYNVVYSYSGGNADIATASINEQTGAITVTGVSAGTTEFIVTASCDVNGTMVTSPSVTLKVTVTGQKNLTLDKTAATVFIDVPVTIKATVTNAVAADLTVTAVSSDTGVATVSVNKSEVTINGVKAGTADITVSYTENNETVKAVCNIKVMDHPKNNTTEKLKDSSGNQLYVNENNEYREAVYADFYNTSLKFYVRGETRYQGWQTIDGKVYFFTADGNKVTGEQVIQGAKYNFASDGSLVQGSNGALGIDVSKWNGTIDWNAVKNSGISYVIIRCGYRGSSAGSLIEDPKFASNMKGATAAGLKVGVYFFTQAIDEREAVEEASMVLNQVRNYTISYPIFLDVEASGGRADSIDRATRTAVCRAFCQTIQNEGYTAGIYANKSWLESKIDASALSSYKIWLAQYAAEPTYSGRYDLWQYRSTGSISGISGNVDMNLSYLGY